MVLGKLLFAKLVRKFPTFFAKNEGSLPCSQETFFGPYLDPYKSTPTMHFKVHFNIIIQLCLRLPRNFCSHVVLCFKFELLGTITIVSPLIMLL